MISCEIAAQSVTAQLEGNIRKSRNKQKLFYAYLLSSKSTGFTPRKVCTGLTPQVSIDLLPAKWAWNSSAAYENMPFIKLQGPV